MKLTGKAALVSGAGGGIGRAISLAFVEAGAAVACCDIDQPSARRDRASRPRRRRARNRPALRRCRRGGEPTPLQPRRMTAFGRLDILVSGAAPLRSERHRPRNQPRRLGARLAVNLTGSFLLSRAALPCMIAAGGGSIIFIASQLGRVGSAGRAAYCATKGALIQLAKVMAIDHAAQNIRVNTLSPGAVETQRTLHRYGSFEAAREKTRPEAPAGPARHAAGDRARQPCFSPATPRASFTGSDLLVDGGYTAI